jgi:hypothetical protein
MQRRVFIFLLFIITAITIAGCGGSGGSSSGDTTVGVPNVPGDSDSPAVANSISFVSASPKTIGLKGMGGVGVQETSTVTFKVFDKLGKPMGGVDVKFELNTKVGGLDLTTEYGTTADNGTVSTIVLSGTIATPVRVTATVIDSSPTILTQSDQLVVSTGMPAQDGFSISIEKLSTESLNVDGVIDVVTARLSDHFHNPVPDGTAVYFTTSGGSIQPSCTTSEGACSVNWTSQNPRPENGRAVILAYAIGEEAFIDSNGNGVADAGEFTDDSEAFRNDDESSLSGIATRQANETFIDFNGDRIFNAPDTKYNGFLQGTAYVGTAPKSKHIFSNSTIVMASSSALITNTCSNPIAVGLKSTTSCTIGVSDVLGNTMPVGTTVTITLETTEPGTTVTTTPDGATTESAGLSMPKYDTYTFPNTNYDSGVSFNINITDPNETTHAIGALTIKVTSPGGVATTSVYNII